jgi:hypothetical protein
LLFGGNVFNGYDFVDHMSPKLMMQPGHAALHYAQQTTIVKMPNIANSSSPALFDKKSRGRGFPLLPARTSCDIYQRDQNRFMFGHPQ